MVKKCLVSVFSRPSAALALPPQPKWHALAQKTSMHAANAMEATGRPRGIFMPARVRTEWARPRKSGMVVFHRAFSLDGRFLASAHAGVRTLTRAAGSAAPIESAARPEDFAEHGKTSSHSPPFSEGQGAWSALVALVLPGTSW